MKIVRNNEPFGNPTFAEMNVGDVFTMDVDVWLKVGDTACFNLTNGQKVETYPGHDVTWHPKAMLTVDPFLEN